MIKKLYDFRQVDVPAALLQAEVTREELEQELFLAASRFTQIVAPADAIAKGDVVTLEFADEKAEGGLRRVYANVGKDFQDVEALLPGLQVGQQVAMRYARQDVVATITAVKRPVVPTLTDELVQQLAIEGVSNTDQLADHLFAKLAEGQRKRKFRGIMGIVSKAVMENTEFEALEQTHPWYQVLHGQLMARVEGFAAREGKTVEEVLPMAMRMPDKSLEECRQAMVAMCVERARQAALGQAYAQADGAAVADAQAPLSEQIESYMAYFSEAIYRYMAPKIQVDRL